MTTITVETESAGAYADASEADLHRLVSQLNHANSYLIVHRTGSDLYAQAAIGRKPDGSFDDGYVVEYAVGDSDLRQATVTTPERVYELLAGWAYDRPGWRESAEWSVLSF
jgi:hypothetical protein